MSTWKKQLEHEFRKVDELTNVIAPQEIGPLKEVTARFPLRIPKYYYDLIDPDDPNDPIRQLSIPQFLETDASGELDTSGESLNTKFEGVQHKYKETMLVLTTNACFMYCRHCFRKRLVGYTSDEISKRMDQTLDYLQRHQEINNVLLSGGDSFALSNPQIEEYLEGLTAVEHLDFIRFGTRVPVVFPQRITEDEALLELLGRYNKIKQLVVVTQFNHPREVTPQATAAVKALLAQGIPVNNQMVLLKGVNDKPAVIAKLMNKLTAIGAAPYYVFQCRPVSAVKNTFQLPLEEAYEIVETARGMLNGQGKRFKFAMSHPRGKIEILAKHAGQLLFKFHQAKDPEDQSRVFARAIVPGARWLDRDLQLIN